MAEDEQRSGEQAEETPAAEETQPEEVPAEEALAEDAATEAPEEAEPAAEEPAGEESADAPAEAAPAEEAPADEAPAAEAVDQAPAEESAPAAGKKSGDLPPGADLDPIALEPDARLSAEERARLEAEEEERARRDAALAEDGDEEPAATSRAPAAMESGARYIATGKRKSSIARVILTPGGGAIEVNSRQLEEYFPRPLHQTMARQPLSVSGYEGTVDVRIRVHGGGIGGQAGAVRHGIARALTEIDPELRGDLKRRGFLTRDARVKERRKAGLKKARKRPQFSKR
jgi:small subunit ribosomal protein S9